MKYYIRKTKNKFQFINESYVILCHKSEKPKDSDSQLYTDWIHTSQTFNIYDKENENKILDYIYNKYGTAIEELNNGELYEIDCIEIRTFKFSGITTRDKEESTHYETHHLKAVFKNYIYKNGNSLRTEFESQFKALINNPDDYMFETRNQAYIEWLESKILSNNNN